MALLRLAVALAVGGASAACGQAGAQAPAQASGITPPAGWTALPAMAKAATDAAQGDGITVAGCEAWGDPARGCYAVWLALRGAGASADQVIAGITGEQLAPTEIVAPAKDGDGTGIVALAFARGGYAGRLRARVADSSVTALACFANLRERAACEARCGTLLGALP